jgi:mono/diheme cytochrome c family protein
MSATPDQPRNVEQSAASDESILDVHDHLRSHKPDKASGYSKTPLILLGLMCTMVFFGSIYLAHYSIRFDPLVVNERASREKPGAAKAPVITPAMLGKRVFTANCVACHQATGMGIPTVYPPLVGSEWVAGSEERLVRIVLHGLSGPIKVAGKDFNNVMTPFGALLKDEQIAQVLSYIRSEWGNTGAEVSPATVARIRAETADRKSPWTAAELEQIGK